MEQIQRLFNTVRTWANEFELGRAYWVLLALLVVVCLHYLLVSTLLFRLIASWREPLVRLIHPDLFPKGSVWRDRVADLQTWLHRASSDLLEANTVKSRQRTYTLIDRLSSGDLCDVHMAVSKERRYVLKQARVADGNRLLSKEYDIVKQLLAHGGDSLYGRYLPWPMDKFMVDGRRATAFTWRDGFIDASSVLRRYPEGLEGRHIAWIFKRLLEVLGYVHQLGWIHGAVLPPHLLLHTGNHGLQLLGWTHAERHGASLRVVSARYKAWYPPECHGRRKVTPATDIYLAAKCMLWLSGGNPLNQSVPDHVPRKIGQCLRECLSDSPTLRPRDAWTLHREFTDLLEDVYGPPKFCPLELS